LQATNPPRPGQQEIISCKKLMIEDQLLQKEVQPG
jgi:hypothetical protein